MAGMTHNGPAIKGGCVTRRQSRWQELAEYFVPVNESGGYGAVFGVMLQVILSITRVALQFL
jgi:hypothetical protein